MTHKVGSIYYLALDRESFLTFVLITCALNFTLDEMLKTGCRGQG